MKQVALILVVVLSLSYPLAAQARRIPDSVRYDTRSLAYIDQVVRDAIQEKQAYGAVIVVGTQNRILYRKAFGLRTAGPGAEPMTLDTIFDMASLTKATATATSILILAERGKLSLSDRVSKYLPEFKDKEGVTLRHLLTHYSGLPPDVDVKTPWKGYETAMQLAYQEKLQAEPGMKFIYSDINYFLLSEVVHRVTGQFIHEFARQNIFEPLGMKDTGFLPPAEKKSRIAPTEPRDGEMIRGEVHDPTSFRMGGIAGHAGLFSTARDMSIFAQMILNGGIYQGVRILSPYAVLAMTTPQSPPGNSQARGYGWDIDTSYSIPRGDFFPAGSFGHTGFTGTSLWMDPHSGMFVLTLTSRLYPDGKGNVGSLRARVASVAASAVRIDIRTMYR